MSHIAELIAVGTELLLGNIFLCLFHGKVGQPFLIFLSKIDSNFFNRGQDHQVICPDLRCQEAAHIILVNHGADADKLSSSVDYRDTAAAAGNYNMSCFHQRPDCFQLPDSLWHRGSYRYTVASPRIFHAVDALSFFFFCFFFCHKSSDWLGRVGECLVVLINLHLGKYGRNFHIKVSFV